MYANCLLVKLKKSSWKFTVATTKLVINSMTQTFKYLIFYIVDVIYQDRAKLGGGLECKHAVLRGDK